MGEQGKKFWSVHFEDLPRKNARGDPKNGSKMHAFFPKGGFLPHQSVQVRGERGGGGSEKKVTLKSRVVFTPFSEFGVKFDPSGSVSYLNRSEAFFTPFFPYEPL